MGQDVDPPDSVPSLVGHFGTTGNEYSGVGAEEIDRPEPLFGGLEETYRVILDFGVGLHRHHHRSNVLGNGFGGADVDVADHDPGGSL